jgi:pimeloyl-ACP methyl ester carboxylesterase
MDDTLESWEASGEYRTLLGHRVFTMTAPALGDETLEPLLVLHGFPTSSYDFHSVLDELRAHRRVFLFDMLGYGLSDKPDVAYTMSLQADIAAAFVDEVGVRELALLTHDMGNTVGGELLARQVDGAWPVTVTRRALANGSIYIGMAHLSAGQEFLLSLPDARLPADGPVGEAGVRAGIAGTLSPHAHVDEEELHALARLVVHHDGHRVMPRLIRYIEERRTSESRFTGAIETHPSPVGVVWGADDPIAVVAMVERFRSARSDATITVLDGVGHYPMVEAPDRFAAATASLLASPGRA